MILSVGVGQTYMTIGAAAAAAQDHDIIEVHAGTYHEAVTFHADGLTVRGVEGRPVVDLTGLPISNGKAIFVSAGADFTVENVELTGAAVGDENGAGIRWEGAGTLTVRDCVFRDNEDGILGGGGAHPENAAVIEHNEFVGNGRGDRGYTHNLYINDAASLIFRGNWSHALDAGGDDIGHLFKSRAHHTEVLYNRLTAEATHSSYEINIPQGGEAIVVGNLIQQRVGSQRTMISFGDGDGTQYTGSSLVVVNNTFVSESAGPATFVRTTQADAQLTIRNNLFIGPGTVSMGGVVTMDHNVMADATAVVDVAAFDYHLVASSPAIDVGIADAHLADSQYVQPAATEPRGTSGAAPDVGAYEFNNAPTVDGPDGDDTTDGATDGGDDTSPVGESTGCCSTSSAPASSSLLLTGLVLFGLARRRRR